MSEHTSKLVLWEKACCSHSRISNLICSPYIWASHQISPSTKLQLCYCNAQMFIWWLQQPSKGNNDFICHTLSERMLDSFARIFLENLPKYDIPRMTKPFPEKLVWYDDNYVSTGGHSYAKPFLAKVYWTITGRN